MAADQSSALDRVGEHPAPLAAVETATAALSARAKAEVEARFIIAYRNPRNLDQVRQDLVAECKRPKFAEVARYRKPVGGKSIEGPSARFAEAAARAMRNLDVSAVVVFEDSERITAEVSAVDLEANVRHAQEAKIRKTVERKKPQVGRVILGQRVNTDGEPVYLLEATEDEAETKLAAAVSKARRNVILLHLPADIVDECQELCIQTQRKQDKTDPDAARKRLLDSLAVVGVRAEDVRSYLGHDPGTLSPAELEELRAVWIALQEKAATWKDLLDAKLQEREPTAQQPEQPKGKGQATKPATSADKARDTLARVREEQRRKREQAKAQNGQQAPDGEQKPPQGEQKAPDGEQKPAGQGQAAQGQPPAGKSRGRPKGSKNKPKKEQAPPAPKPPNRQPGDDSDQPGMDPNGSGWV